MSQPLPGRRRFLATAALSSLGLGACGFSQAPRSPTPAPEPPLPSRTRATCRPTEHRFSLDQPVNHGDTAHGVLDPRIRYLLPPALSPDTSELVGSYRDAIVVWETASGVVSRILGTASWCEVLAWSPDGVEVVSEGVDDLVRLDAACGSDLGSYRGHERIVSEAGAGLLVVDASFSPDGRRLFSIGADGTLRAWAVADGKEMALSRLDDPRSLSVSPDGSSVAVSTGGGRVLVHDARDLGERGSFDIDSARWRFLDNRTLLGGVDGGRVLSVATDGTTRRERFTVDGDVHDVAVSPDGAIAVAMTRNDGAWLAPLDGSHRPMQLQRPEYFGGVIGGVSFSRDGATIYVCDQVTGIVAYDLSGAVLRRFEAP